MKINIVKSHLAIRAITDFIINHLHFYWSSIYNEIENY